MPDGDKLNTSYRGRALSLLVMPNTLLTAEGLITVEAGIVIFVCGVWPLVFNGAPLNDEALQQMAFDVSVFVWGVLVCHGAKKMQELSSYTWAMVGSVLGVLPLLIGIFAIIVLQNPIVKSGFEEYAGEKV